MSLTTRDSILHPAGPSAEWTLADLLAVLARRRAWIFACILACSAAALLYRALSTPRYRATATIELQNQSAGAFGLDTTTSDRPSSAVSDSFDDNLNLQTEIGILQSDAVALDAIRRTGLESTPGYFAPGADSFPALRRLVFWNKSVEPLTVPLSDAPNRRYAALKIFARHRKIAASAGTRLISIGYSDPSPERAAAVVAAIVQAASDLSFQSRSAATAQSAEWLQAQLAGLKQHTDALDARAASLDRAAGDFGDDSSHNPVLARLDQLNTALSAAESRRIVREAIDRAAQSGNPEALSSLGGNSAAGPDTQNSFALLQNLRAQQASSQAQLAESGKRYGENWPGVAEQRARLANTDQSIQDEIRRLGERAHSDYEISVQSESAARQAFEQQKDLASHITGDAVSLRLARQEADQSRALYTTLLGRLQQAGVLEGLRSANFTVINPALVPAPGHPSNPSLPLLLACAIAAGTCLGSAAAVFRELTDDAVHSAADLEALLDAAVFAALPSASPARPWYRRLLPAPASQSLTLEASAAPDFPFPDPASPFAESLHRLRASLLLSHSGRAPQIITIAAAEPVHPREADSPSLARGLAAVLAQHGAPVLFIDADLRSAPPVSDSSDPGLSQLLASDSPAIPANHSGHPLLSVLHAGPRPPCPSELIASARFHSLLTAWRNRFTFIVIQSPAAIYADALVLAQLSDAVLLCAQAGKSRKPAVLPAFHALSRQVRPHAVLGCILEGVRPGVPYAQV